MVRIPAEILIVKGGGTRITNREEELRVGRNLFCERRYWEVVYRALAFYGCKP